MRWLLPLTVVLVGCVASLPDDPSVTADLAAEAARLLVQLRSEVPPAPQPSSDQCDNCGGTGTLGDGRITVKCPSCDGTGRKPKSVLVRE